MPPRRAGGQPLHPIYALHNGCLCCLGRYYWKRPPFTVVERSAGIAIPRETGAGRWRLPLTGEGWESARIAYYPLWEVRGGGTLLPVRRGEWGDLEVQAGRATTAEFVYGAALAEKLGLAVSAAGLLACAALALRRRPILQEQITE